MCFVRLHHYTHARRHARTQARTHARTHKHGHTNTHTHTHTNIHTQTHTHTHTHTHTPEADRTHKDIPHTQWLHTSASVDTQYNKVGQHSWKLDTDT